jgi:hypothetical protein
VLVAPEARNVSVTFQAKGEDPIELFMLLLKVHKIGFSRENDDTFILFRPEDAPEILGKDILILDIARADPTTIATMLSSLFPELTIVPHKNASKITIAGVVTGKMRREIEALVSESDRAPATVRLSVRIIDLARSGTRRLDTGLADTSSSIALDNVLTNSRTLYTNNIVAAEGAVTSFFSGAEYPVLAGETPAVGSGAASGETAAVRLFKHTKVGQAFEARVLRAKEKSCVIDLSIDLSQVLSPGYLPIVGADRFATTLELAYDVPTLINLSGQSTDQTAAGWSAERGNDSSIEHANSAEARSTGRRFRSREKRSDRIYMYLEVTKL